MDAKKEEEDEDDECCVVCERRFKVLAILFRSCCGARLGCRCTHDDDDDNEIALPHPENRTTRSVRQENRRQRKTGKEKK